MMYRRQYMAKVSAYIYIQCFIKNLWACVLTATVGVFALRKFGNFARVNFIGGKGKAEMKRVKNSLPPLRFFFSLFK